MGPLLSIGIIFKNEARCLERCLKSLGTLRSAVPCELVMADTGAGDGSRSVAERYADVLFDFPWTDDFSAARNAVMDRCSGEWYLSLDADEWLDENISQLKAFLQSDAGKKRNYCGLLVRNYYADNRWNYSDFLAIRMIRMSTGQRYEGRIHEAWNLAGRHQKDIDSLKKTLIHHDGYVVLNNGSMEGREKLRRNMRLLQKSLEDSPDDLQLLVQCIESCGANYDAQLPYINRAVKIVRAKTGKWLACGANILRHAVCAAHKLGLSEFWEWVALAEEMFPNSVYTTVDIQFYAAEHAWCDMDCPEMVRRGQRYLDSVWEYRSGKTNPADLLQGPLNNSMFHFETNLRIYIARAQVYIGNPQAALKTLETLDYDTMDEPQVGILLESLMRIHTLSYHDTAPFLLQFWERLNEAKPSREIADRRRQSFVTLAAIQFMPDFIKDETARMGGNISLYGMDRMQAEEWNIFSKLKPCRHGYTMFKPLADKIDIGIAAILMDEKDVKAATGLLTKVKSFEEMPIQALIRALNRGVSFPLPERPLNPEEMDNLAARMTQEKDSLCALARRMASGKFFENWQTLLWTRSLVLAAIRTCEWKNEVSDMALAKSFAGVEKAFIAAYYAPDVLQKENVGVLPAMHRFGWCCAQAFQALDCGDAAGYTHMLRQGLKTCESMKNMVEFLLENTPELQMPPPSPELLVLAEQVRTMLAAYDPKDPAVRAIRESPVYQRVAYLIEGDGAPDRQ